MSNNQQTSKVRSKVNFQLGQHEDNEELVDLNLEVRNFTFKQLSDLLNSLAKSLTPPDEAT